MVIEDGKILDVVRSPRFAELPAERHEVRGFICPVQVCRGLAVMVVSHRPSVGLQVDTAREPSSHRVCQRPRVFSS